MNLAVLYNKIGKYDESIKEFEKVLEIEPGNPIAHYGLGYFYARQKNHELAWQHARKAEVLKHPGAQKLLEDLQDLKKRGTAP